MVGGTAALTATVSPENAANKKVTWTSDNAGVATVDQNGEVKGVSAGTANIIATTDDGGFTASCAVTVIAETNTNAAKAEISLTNPYSEKHNDTVLVGTNANIRVRIMDKDGEPVGNAPVVLTTKRLEAQVYQHNKTDDVLITDKDGYVTFVYGEDLSKVTDKDIDAMDDYRIGSYKLTATVAGSNVSADTTLKFGAFTFGTDDAEARAKKNKSDPVIGIRNEVDPDDDIKDLEPGTNAKAANALRTTSNGNGKLVEYVGAQQVSDAKGERDHSVTFSTCAYLVLPADEIVNNATEFKKDVSFDSGEYGLYDKKSWDCVVDETKVSNIQYATVNFSELTLSKHSILELNAYLVKTTADKEAADQVKEGLQPFNTRIIDGSNETFDTWAWQIPVQDLIHNDSNAGDYYLYVTADLISKGQINNEKKAGFKVRDIVGVYDKTATVLDSRIKEKLDDVKVEWDTEKEVVMTEPRTLEVGTYEDYYDVVRAILNKLNNIEAMPIDSNGNKDTYGTLKYTYKYSVPSFPHTGNAVITVYDQKNSIVSYYAAPTRNRNNQNIFASSDIYEISKDEATKHNIGVIKSSTDSQVVVDSTETGVTHLVGTIISTTNKDFVLDDSNNKVYSSVQWNPIPTMQETAAVGVAFAGQRAKIRAQLIDINGNEVNVPNVSIEFSADGKDVKAGEVISGTSVNVISISNNGKTDPNGRVELVLSSEKKVTLNDIKAKTPTNYSAAFKLTDDSEVSSSIDLCWLDADVSFTADAKENIERKTTETSPSAIVATDPNVGANWKYGVQVVGTFEEKANGTPIIPNSINEWNNGNGDLKIVVNGVKTVITVDGNKGTYEVGTNELDITSTSNAPSNAKFALNKTSFEEGTISVKFENSKDSKDAKYVGEGAVSVEKDLTLNIGWGTFVDAGEFVLPTSRFVPLGDNNKKSYFKVIDEYGNPITGKAITLHVMTTHLEKTKAAPDDVVFDNNDIELRNLVSGDDGIVSFTLSGCAIMHENDTATVTATIDEISETLSQTFKWVKPNDFRVTDAVYSKADNALVLTFNDGLCPESMNVDASDVVFSKHDNTGAVRSYKVSKISVDGKKLILSLPDSFLESINLESEFEVTLNPVTGGSIDYYLASEATGEFKGNALTVLIVGGDKGFLSKSIAAAIDDLDDLASYITSVTTQNAISAAAIYKELGITGIDETNAHIYDSVLALASDGSTITYTTLGDATVTVSAISTAKQIIDLVATIQKDVDSYKPYVEVAKIVGKVPNLSNAWDTIDDWKGVASEKFADKVKALYGLEGKDYDNYTPTATSGAIVSAVESLLISDITSPAAVTATIGAITATSIYLEGILPSADGLTLVKKVDLLGGLMETTVAATAGAIYGYKVNIAEAIVSKLKTESDDTSTFTKEDYGTIVDAAQNFVDSLKEADRKVLSGTLDGIRNKLK